MQEQSTIDVSGQPDPGALAADSSPVEGAASSSADVQTQPDQSVAIQDPLEGIPTSEELKTLVEQNVPHAKALEQLRGAYEPLKTQFDELSGKFKPFEPYADRFSTPEEVESIVKLSDTLFGWEKDPTSGELVPTTDKFAESLPPLQADTLAADLALGMTRDPKTGEQVQRFEQMLKVLAENPEQKAKALRALGVNPNESVTAPAWTPTPEELEKVKPEFQEIYKKLPFEEREELKLNSPDYINNALRKEKLIQDTEAERNERIQAQENFQREQTQRVEQEASQAGDAYVESQITEGYSGFVNNICERWQPTDDPQTNKLAGHLVGVAVVALSHRETRFAAEQFFKETGVLDDKNIQAFDNSRIQFAQNGHNYGYLAHKGKSNGNDPSIGQLKTTASRGMQSLLAQGNNLASQIIKHLDKLFVAKAEAHNNTLAQAAGARPPIAGSPVNPATDRQIPQIAGREPFSRESVTRFVRS